MPRFRANFVYDVGLGILLSRLAIQALPKVPFVGAAVAGFPSLGLEPGPLIDWSKAPTW